MKTIYKLTAGLLLIGSVTANAQQKNVLPAPREAVNVKLNPMHSHEGRAYAPAAKANTTESKWLNYAVQLDNILNGQIAQGAYMLLFPDSGIRSGFYQGGGIAYPRFHKAATLLDPKNMPDPWLNRFSSYTLDSLAIGYGYLRHTPANVTDTLEIKIIKGDDSKTFDLGGVTTYQDIDYVYQTNAVGPAQVLASFTYLLTENDSSNFYNEILLATPGVPQQTNGRRIGAVVTFKPGFTYTINDSIQGKNGFYLFSYEENGTGTDPVFHGTFSDKTSDLNCSYEVPSSVRYNYDAGGWNGYFIPTWSWATGFAYEHHGISFLLTSAVVGINESSANGVRLFQNVPNPANGTTTIGYELSAPSAIQISITDVLGKEVATVNDKQQTAGRHQVDFNAATLPSGIYYYTLTTQQAKLTKKLIVE
jgi:hypothetical protein